MNLRSQYKKVERFEKALAKYTGSPYVVCVDSCTNALLLCLQYEAKIKTVYLPKNTYIGVALAAYHAKKRVIFKDISWKGVYQIKPTRVYDAAKRFTSNMYITNTLMCLSFHYKKHLKIGRGGAILTDNKAAYDWFIRMRNNGKNIDSLHNKQKFTLHGYNMLLHPDLAIKGIKLLKNLKLKNKDLPYEDYGDLSKQSGALFE